MTWLYLGSRMDFEDVNDISGSFGINLYDYAFWSPEQFESALVQPTTEKEEAFYQLFATKFDELYGKCGPDYMMALRVLVENHIPFLDRISGRIKDEWLSSKRFSRIAKECAFLLDNLKEAEEWQVCLAGVFRDMIPSPTV